MKFAETIFKKLHIIIILLKTKYLQYSVISFRSGLENDIL